MMLELMRAEGLKLKLLCRWMPVIQGIILIGMTALEWYLYFRQGPGGIYAGFAVMYMFLSFVFLLGITLLASIMAGTEHETKAWKVSKELWSAFRIKPVSWNFAASCLHWV